MLQFNIPIRIISEANGGKGGKDGRGHWQKYRRQKLQTRALSLFMRGKVGPENLPCTITLTRVAPRSLDEDNLAYALKHHRDFIADLLIPGKRMGYADSDKRIEWKYAQKKSGPKQYFLEIDIEPREMEVMPFEENKFQVKLDLISS